MAVKRTVGTFERDSFVKENEPLMGAGEERRERFREK